MIALVNVLFLLAHNDDEYFSSLQISEELRLGNRVLIAYLTHGSIYGVASEIRIQESMNVLIGLGVNPCEILMLGYENNIFDGKLCERIVDAYQSLRELVPVTASIGRVYVMAWEGGHPDHDASHMIGVAFARVRGLQKQLYEFPAYHAARNCLKLSGVMQLLDGNDDLTSTVPNRIKAFRAFTLALKYKTQRRTFLALLPGSAFQLLIRGYQTCRLVPENRDYTNPPHRGKLFYERRFKLSFATFIKDASALYKYMQPTG